MNQRALITFDYIANHGTRVVLLSTTIKDGYDDDAP